VLIKAVDKKELVLKLNNVLMYEHGHLGIYATQSKTIGDRQIAHVFDRFRHLEEEHAAKIRNLIVDLGGVPSLISRLGDEGGKLLGLALQATGTIGVLKADLKIEEIAVKNYHELCNEIEDESIRDRMLENMIDARLMYLWLTDKITEYEEERNRQCHLKGYPSEQ